jgi:pyridoxal phosphate enzyme (YggS family)
MSLVTSIAENLETVNGRIHRAAQMVGRHPDQVSLIVVTKSHPIEIVQAAIEAGATQLGENYVEEALPKIAKFPVGEYLSWHMIGHIQSRKAKPVSGNFSWVHTVDSPKLARRLDQFAREFERQIPVLLECNVSGEETKAGWIAWNELEWHALAQEISPLLEMENLIPHGLMTMAPFFDRPEKARPYFLRLRKLRDYLADEFPQHDWKELSMGMSGDFEVAVQEGATMVRIGTAILGERQKREDKL